MIVMTNTDFTVLLGFLKEIIFLRFVPPGERFLCRETGRAEWTHGYFIQKPLRTSLKNGNIYVNIDTKRYFKIIPQRN